MSKYSWGDPHSERPIGVCAPSSKAHILLIQRLMCISSITIDGAACDAVLGLLHLIKVTVLKFSFAKVMKLRI